MSSALTRFLSLLCVALLVSFPGLAQAQAQLPDCEGSCEAEVNEPPEDAPEPDAGGGGSTSASSGGANTGPSNAANGGLKTGGTIVVPGPDMSSCECGVVGRASSRGVGSLVFLLAAAALLRKHHLPGIRA